MTTTTKPAPPSKVARAAVPWEWGPIHRQTKIGPGVFGFSCAAHGGIVVVEAAARKATSAYDHHLDEVRETVWQGNYRVQGYSAHSGPRGGRRALLPGAWWKPGVWDHKHTVYVLEEDCEWCLAPLAFEVYHDRGYFVADYWADRDHFLRYAAEIAERWLD